MRDYGKSLSWPPPSTATRRHEPMLRAMCDRWRATMILRPYPRSEWPQLRMKALSQDGMASAQDEASSSSRLARQTPQLGSQSLRAQELTVTVANKFQCMLGNKSRHLRVEVSSETELAGFRKDAKNDIVYMLPPRFAIVQATNLHHPITA
ncbi:hypothetical protein LSTR_LSTR007127 [Laodelphax striatellus]|uniref:Uncharacterized protein n=1 Tax=Laodelphax striatellus TaxID=195883 RepID=A0A482XHN7_LAOST|nr:hypothetical protein LSTR_LSTR007127 [Laodelphax striatellus]